MSGKEPPPTDEEEEGNDSDGSAASTDTAVYKPEPSLTVVFGENGFLQKVDWDRTAFTVHTSEKHMAYHLKKFFELLGLSIIRHCRPTRLDLGRLEGLVDQSSPLEAVRSPTQESVDEARGICKRKGFLECTVVYTVQESKDELPRQCSWNLATGPFDAPGDGRGENEEDEMAKVDRLFEGLSVGEAKEEVGQPSAEDGWIGSWV